MHAGSEHPKLPAGIPHTCVHWLHVAMAEPHVHICIHDLHAIAHGRSTRAQEHKHKKIGAVLVSTDMNRARLRAQTQAEAVHGSTRANMHQWDHVHTSAKKKMQQCMHV